MHGSMHRDDWNRRYTGRELLWTSEPNRFLVAETAALRPGRALDLACGEGRNAVWLAERGWQVTGVDFAEVRWRKPVRLPTGAASQANGLPPTCSTTSREQGAFDLVLLFYLQVPAPECAEGA